jgi:hypothetical protein
MIPILRIAIIPSSSDHGSPSVPLEEDGTMPLIVLRSIVAKIRATHPADFASLDRLTEFLDRWELVGRSPNSPNRLELYGQIDGVRHTAVIAPASDAEPFSVLITFHRIYARKVLSRERNGRLKRR